MLKFKTYLTEKAIRKGAVNLKSSSYPQAERVGIDILGEDFHKILPHFESNYHVAHDLVGGATYARKDMPRIRSRNSNGFYEKLKSDGISVKKERVEVQSLLPIQKEIWVDNVFRDIKKRGHQKSKRSLTSDVTFVIDSNHRLIDGHHRWLAGMFFDPTMKVNVLRIDMQMDDLVEYARNYSDSVGSERNH